MAKRVLFAVVLCLFGMTSGFARGDDVDSFIKAKAPQFILIQQADVPKQTLTVVVPVLKPVQKEVPAPKGGKGNVKVTTFEVVHELRVVPLKQYRVETAGGKQVTEPDDLKALAGKTAIMAEGPSGVDPLFLKVFAKDAIVLTPFGTENKSPK